MKIARTFLALLAGAVVADAAMTLPADAGSNRQRDRIYADSFGNLVIYSRSGYKRIVVGQGHLAEELANYETGGGDPDVVYNDRNDRKERRRYKREKCVPVLLKGRSYMYGLPDGYLPAPGCDGIRY